jgi:PAS domain S-box-containing protein
VQYIDDMARRQFAWCVELDGSGRRDVIAAWPTVHPDDADRVRSCVERALATDDELEIEHRVLLLSGKVAWYEQRGVIERDSRGKPLVIRGISTDVTARKHAAQEMREDLAAAERLHAVSTALITEERAEALYAPVLEAAVMIMRSQFASIQILDPEREALSLLGHRGFTAEAVELWRWVDIDGQSSCGHALRSGERVIVSEIEDGRTAGASLLMSRRLGIRAVQTTPLVTRKGQLIGALSTHWRTPYTPTQRELRNFDVLARQAADLLERVRNEDALRAASWRDAFRVALTDALRQSNDAVAIQSAASRLLGEYLGASRAYYAEIDLANDTCTIGDSFFTESVVSLGGTFPLGALSQALTAEFRAGHTSVVRNCRNIPGVTREVLDYLERTGRTAFISVPLIKSGQLVGGLWVQDIEPRAWTRDQVKLVEETAERTWSALERVRSRASVTANEERLRLAVEAAGMGTWMIDFDRGISVMDASLNRMMGFPYQATTQPIGARAWNVHPDDVAAYKTAWREGVATGTYAAEYRLEAADGSWRWVASRGRATTAGPTRQLFGVTIDITERKHMEETLRENDRRKDEFLATLAHELRNPLAPLVTGLEVMRLSDNPELHERMRAMMEDQTRQLVRLVDDLLDVARISQGKIQLDKSRVDLASVIESAINATRPAIEAAKHDLQVVMPACKIELDADRTRVAQIVTNLLTNAARYTPDGGTITLAVEATETDVVIRVQDNGIGMSRELIERVFDIFVQGDRGHGLGIGLALVKRMVELHEGTVRACSDGVGCGSTFEVRLPIARALQAVSEPVAAKMPASKQRILVVDDNAEAVKALALYLRMLGNEVETAGDGRTALAVAEEFKPDVILMDLGMPTLDGLAAARELRRLPWGAGIRLIAVTGWGQEHDRNRTKEAGFDMHLVKPVDPQVLTRALAG